MMLLSASACLSIFDESIALYHQSDSVDFPLVNPYPKDSLDHSLFEKNWIDTVQWHLEDIMRVPNLSADLFIATKRRIDLSNQARVDKVEAIDDAIYQHLAPQMNPAAPLNSETPAWILDRMSILRLKIWHMGEQVQREDASESHREACRVKWQTLEEQSADLLTCYDQLMEEIKQGVRRYKLYRQMKMYNDASLNPSLYKAPK
jgi:hypothetical protein